ncbi:hypothetical protein MTY_1339 [Moorella thermoacetica Y72]|uniref:Uncharacterized protein n=1 Tax=Moorella thermoacetica Y72 TaxID=1325331 RepID=A0A0S6UAI8_NEOTH|nr:hypothetical protein MTY_1339 [Moorella thermoacetica Y72]
MPTASARARSSQKPGASISFSRRSISSPVASRSKGDPQFFQPPVQFVQAAFIVL